MYRPTVRYDDVYKEYVENLYHSTHLDRSQIIRAALFIAGYTEQFSKIVEPYLRRGVSLPEPVWNENDHELWLKHKATNQVDTMKLVPKKKTESIRQEQMSVEEQPIASPKVFSPIMGDVSIKVGRRQYPPR